MIISVTKKSVLQIFKIDTQPKWHVHVKMDMTTMTTIIILLYEWPFVVVVVVVIAVLKYIYAEGWPGYKSAFSPYTRALRGKCARVRVCVFVYRRSDKWFIDNRLTSGTFNFSLNHTEPW